VTINSLVDGPADGPVVVLGSAIGTDAGLWARQVPALAQRYRVVRYEHRGHGRSPAPPGPYTLADLGGDVLARLDSLGVDRASFGGVSLGAMVAMWIAAHAPGRVDRLVLVATSAKLPQDLWAERARVARAEGLEPLADRVVERWFTPAYAAGHPDVVAAFRAAFLSTDPEGYAGCCDAIRSMDLERHLGRIAAPALVVAGTDDVATPPSHGERIRDGIRHGRLALVPGAAHLPTVSHPDVIAAMVKGFLDEFLD